MLSLIVSDANQVAVHLYRKLGFELVDKRPIVKEDWQNDGTDWLLMTKSVAGG